MIEVEEEEEVEDVGERSRRGEKEEGSGKKRGDCGAEDGREDFYFIFLFVNKSSLHNPYLFMYTLCLGLKG
jgi:hypothetical protein